MKSNNKWRDAFQNGVFAPVVLLFSMPLLDIVFKSVLSKEHYPAYSYIIPVVAVLVSAPMLRKTRHILMLPTYIAVGLFCCFDKKYWGYGYGFVFVISMLKSVAFFICGMVVGMGIYVRYTKQSQSLLLERPVWYYLKRVNYVRILGSWNFIIPALFVLVMFVVGIVFLYRRGFWK